MSESDSSPSMILTEEEVRALTNRQTRPAQRKMLLALGVNFGIRADASLVVLRSAVEAALGGSGATKARARKKTEPRFDLVK